VNSQRCTYRFQKASLWSWLLGSVSTITAEAVQMLNGSLDITRGEGESDDDWEARRKQLRQTVEKRAIVLIHAIFQVRLRSFAKLLASGWSCC
jgi:hypothetical protein